MILLQIQGAAYKGVSAVLKKVQNSKSGCGLSSRMRLINGILRYIFLMLDYLQEYIDYRGEH